MVDNYLVGTSNAISCAVSKVRSDNYTGSTCLDAGTILDTPELGDETEIAAGERCLNNIASPAVLRLAIANSSLVRSAPCARLSWVSVSSRRQISSGGAARRA